MRGRRCAGEGGEGGEVGEVGLWLEVDGLVGVDDMAATPVLNLLLSRQNFGKQLGNKRPKGATQVVHSFNAPDPPELVMHV